MGQGRALKVRHLLVVCRVCAIKRYAMGKPSLLKLRYLLLLGLNNARDVIFVVLGKAILVALLFQLVQCCLGRRIDALLLLLKALQPVFKGIWPKLNCRVLLAEQSFEPLRRSVCRVMCRPGKEFHIYFRQLYPAMLGFRDFLRAVMGMLAFLDKKLLLIRRISRYIGQSSLSIAGFYCSGATLCGD